METAESRAVVRYLFIILCLSAAVSPLRAQSVELVFANFGQADEFCTPSQAGVFTCSDVSQESVRSSGVVAARINADDHFDLVFSTDWEPNRICSGSSDGSFTCVNINDEALSSRDVVAADFNADGLLDVAFANPGMPDQVCLGDGNGGFACGDVSTHTRSSSGLIASDLNGDGFPDLAVSNFGQRALICLNDGTASFSCHDAATPLRKSQRIAAADFNDDGIPDIAIANQDQPNSACLGDGAGFFVCSDVSALGEPSFGVAAADLNSDGAADLAFGNAGARDTICLNDGQGSFTCSYVDAAVLFTLGVVAVDANADDLPDLVFAVRDGRNRLCIGDGSAGFTCADVGDEIESTIAVAAAVHPSDAGGENPGVDPDSDGDGVADAIDECPGTILPEIVPANRLLPNHYALVDDDAIFDSTPSGRGPRLRRVITTADTRGCSCEQILVGTGSSDGNVSFGCPIGVMKEWIMGNLYASRPARASGPSLSFGATAHHNLGRTAALRGNYPNPFNAATVIRFELEDAGPVSLVVYDAMGREVGVLADGTYGAGVHDATFHADHLPSGLYLYRLQTSRGVVQQTMTLLK